MLRPLIRGCTSALIGTSSVCVVASSEATVFDAPQFIEGSAFPSGEDSTAWIAGLAPSSDGSVWVVIVREDATVRLANWRDGDLNEVAPLEIILTDGRYRPCRFVERNDGVLQLVSRTRVWLLHQDGSLIREWPLSAADVDVDRNGLVFALVGGTIRVLDDEGTVLRSWSAPPSVGAFAVAGDRVIVMHYDSETWQPMVRAYSPFGELLQAFSGPEAHGWQRLWALPSGTLLLLGWDGDANYSRDIGALSQCGVHLLSWWWDDPDERYGGCHRPPVLATEDASGHLLTATADPIDCYTGPRIDVYAPFGPGVIVQPPIDDVPYTVDGASYTGRSRFDLADGSTHTFAVAPQTLVSPGTRRDFVEWSDNGAASHQIEIPTVGRGLRFEVETRHFIETIVDSGGSATTSPWIEHGSGVTLTAEPAPGYRFVKWSHPESTGWREGDVLEPEWTHVVNGPESWKASFVREGLVLTISASGSDPWVNTASPASGLRQLWLWAACLDRGISALEADVAGSLTPYGFAPEPACLSVASGGNLLLAIIGCPIGGEANVRLGSWWVMDNGGDFCLAPSAANGTLAVANCPHLVPEASPVGVVGFSSVGDPCRIGALCGERFETLVEDAPADVPLPTALPAEVLLTARGNPFRSAIDLVVSLPDDGSVGIDIFDVAGRRVRTLWQGDLLAGRRIMTWDGRNIDGAAVPAGIYFARMQGAGAIRTTKLVRLQPDR